MAEDDESSLIGEAKRTPGGLAETELLNRYLKLMYSVANEFISGTGISNIVSLPTPEDMVQDSFESFRKAIVDFDPSLGTKLSTVIYTYVQQHLYNAFKSDRRDAAIPDVRAPGDEYFKGRTDKLVDVDQPPQEVDGDSVSISDKISDALTSRPDWQSHYNEIIELVDLELGTDKKKQVFHKLLEHGLYPNNFKDIREELGIKPANFSMILQRDVYPAVEKVVKELSER